MDPEFKIYWFYYHLSSIFYWLGDKASKPMSWECMDGEGKIVEFLGRINYSVYNWLMLKSVYYNDLGGCDVWGPVNEDIDIEPADDKFTAMTFTKPNNDTKH